MRSAVREKKISDTQNRLRFSVIPLLNSNCSNFTLKDNVADKITVNKLYGISG